MRYVCRQTCVAQTAHASLRSAQKNRKDEQIEKKKEKLIDLQSNKEAR